MAVHPVDERLRAYANDNQWGYYLAYCEHGGFRAAANALGVDHTTILKAVGRIKRKAAQHGYAPDSGLVHEAAPGFVIKGTSIRYDEAGAIQQYWNKTKLDGRDPEETIQLPDPKKIVKRSTLYDEQGNVTQQWIAEKPSDEARENLWRIFADELARPLPRIEPTPAPEFATDKLLTGYPVGDHHIGMLSWAEETGANYNTSLAERLLNSASSHLIQAAPASETALIAFLGDFLHYDSFVAVTPTSRNQLDADSRFPKMVRVAIRAMRHMIETALKKHAKVHIIVEIGNHDLSTSIFLMQCLANIYENEPRITVDTSPRHFHYFRFGKNLIGTHHGHGVKMENLPLIMATDCAEWWGKTENRFIWTGHIHHEKVKEVSGCKVEAFPVLPPVDAWAAQKGYRPKREMKSIIFHHDHGEVGRNIVNPGMF